MVPEIMSFGLRYIEMENFPVEAAKQGKADWKLDTLNKEDDAIFDSVQHLYAADDFWNPSGKTVKAKIFKEHRKANKKLIKEFDRKVAALLKEEEEQGIIWKAGRRVKAKKKSKK